MVGFNTDNRHGCGGDYRQGELGTETTNRVNWKFQYRVGDLTLGLAGGGDYREGELGVKTANRLNSYFTPSNGDNQQDRIGILTSGRIFAMLLCFSLQAKHGRHFSGFLLEIILVTF